jgi:type I restriction enzyme S subunit
MNIPENWTETTIGDICETTSGGTPDRGREDYYGGDIPWLKSGELEDDRITQAEESISQTALENSSAKIIPEDTLLIALYGATAGKVGILKFRSAVNQAICAITTPPILRDDFLFYYLVYFRNDLRAKRSGGAQLNLSQGKIQSTTIPLPPQGEQQRIVAKTEELFSKLDSGISELEESKKRLEFYNRAVLKAAMEGKLTRKSRQSISKTGGEYLKNILEYRREKWGDEFQEVFKYSGKGYDEPESADPPEHAEIPEEWTWGTVNQISYVVGGLTKNKSKREDYSTEVPYLRVANVYANELDLDEIKTIKISEREDQTKMLKEGDLLIVEGNGSKSQIGRVALWDGSISPCSHQNHLIKVRILKEALRKFALYWLLSPMGRNAIVDVASSTSGLHTLSISKVRSIPIPIPPKEEAKNIVQYIERKTTVTDQVLRDVENELNRTGRLRQSILKHAFEGKLVPQDLAKEPPTPDDDDKKLEQGAQATLSEVTKDVE